MNRPPPPSPSHFIRSHSASITALFLSLDNERLYSADTGGRVVITNTRTLRPIASWVAHSSSVLGVEEWSSSIITHGRDNKLVMWMRVDINVDDAKDVGSSAAMPETSLRVPKSLCVLDVNALNYCRFSLLQLRVDAGVAPHAMVAVPNLVDSALVDVWDLPSKDRVHAAIGKVDIVTRERGASATGILMAVHLFEAPYHAASSSQTTLNVLTAYENGSLTLRRYTPSGPPTVKSIDGIGWSTLWNVKVHGESVMAMAVSMDSTFAVTVSADHLVAKYDLSNGQGAVHRTKHPGNASLVIRDDARICAVGGWDGRIRIYSIKTLKPLGALSYHKTSIQALTFAQSITGAWEPLIEREDEDGMTVEEKQARAMWLIAGDKEGRISLWNLMELERY